MISIIFIWREIFIRILDSGVGSEIMAIMLIIQRQFFMYREIVYSGDESNLAGEARD